MANRFVKCLQIKFGIIIGKSGLNVLNLFNMEGILTILKNTAAEYLPHIIKAFRAIGDSQDAEILAEISRCKPSEPVEKIVELEQQLYLNRDFDIWELLYQYLDKEIEKLK